MPFETAGESFPGSAFYYLEDVPQLVQTGTRETVQVIGQSTLASASLADIPLAARPLRIVGSGRDHVRAQECMTQAIYYEAASESDAGQRAVAQVVLNRVAHAAYPRSVCGVVYQGSERSTGCQFSFTCDGSLARRPSQTAWSRASRIAREALAGVVYAPVGTATHYHTLAVHPYWAPSLDTVTVIGAHIFYRWKGAAGQPSAFRAGYSGGEPAPGRSRNLTPAAPDPLLAPPTIDLANSPALTPRAAEAAFAPAPSSAAPSAGDQSIPDPAGDVMPGSGAVRSEYANAGRWIARPGG
ncbi:cell wall hydrolase [Erythrobacter arachoides]|uniref:Cell wall hydrolase n=2 Tax=Aurantiacibacter arachoides TaxID=1850444 RepID=A0A844ZZT3_9SPHN|nr:cell wall hydrolase [Aurantiacibacter arachoides]